MFLEQGVENYLLTVQEQAFAREVKAMKEQSTEGAIQVFNSDLYMSKASQTPILLSLKGTSGDSSLLLTRKLYKINNLQMDLYLSFEDKGILLNNNPNEYESFLYIVLPNNLNTMSEIENKTTIYIRSQKYEKYLEGSAEGLSLTSKISKNCEFTLK